MVSKHDKCGSFIIGLHLIIDNSFYFIVTFDYVYVCNIQESTTTP